MVAVERAAGAPVEPPRSLRLDRGPLIRAAVPVRRQAEPVLWALRR